MHTCLCTVFFSSKTDWTEYSQKAWSRRRSLWKHKAIGISSVYSNIIPGCCQWPFSPYTNSASKPPMDFECSEPLSVLCQLYVVEPDKAAGVAGYQLNDENYDIVCFLKPKLPISNEYEVFKSDTKIYCIFFIQSLWKKRANLIIQLK